MKKLLYLIAISVVITFAFSYFDYRISIPYKNGSGTCVIDGNEYKVKNGDVIIIPAGAKHNVINADSTPELKMYTIYAPPHHKDGLLRATKEDAVNNGVEFDGKTTE